MACTDYSQLTEFWINGQFFDAVYCPFGNALGGVVFALVFFGAIGLALYVFSGSMIMPLVLTLILGAIVVAQLPSLAAQLVGGLVLIGIAIGGYMIVSRLNKAKV